MKHKTEKTAKAEQPAKAVKVKRFRKKTNWILYIAIVAFVIYIAVVIVDQNVKIKKGREELSKLDNEITLQTIKLDELKTAADAAEQEDFDSVSDYIERIARENLDYVKSGEVVFINIAGN